MFTWWDYLLYIVMKRASWQTWKERGQAETMVSRIHLRWVYMTMRSSVLALFVHITGCCDHYHSSSLRLLGEKRLITCPTLFQIRTVKELWMPLFMVISLHFFSWQEINATSMFYKNCYKNPLWGDKVSILIHIYPHKPRRKIEVTLCKITRLTPHCMCAFLYLSLPPFIQSWIPPR